MADAENTIAFQGVHGAHSDMACKKAYPYMDSMPCVDFESVFEAVESGKAKLGLIPIENSHAGRVAEIHNLLPETGLTIVGEYFHPVRHHLMAPKGASLETVKTVYSHPQALMQCAKSSRELGLKVEPYGDTAAAAEMVAKEGDTSKAALGSDLAAELYGLDIVKQDMQDSDSNRTLFVAIAKEPEEIEADQERVLTSMIFTTRNISSGLYKALAGFATNNINLLKLESYIPDYASGTAQFFITFEGNPERKEVQQALEELGFFSQKTKVLGVYEADPKRYQ